MRQYSLTRRISNIVFISILILVCIVFFLMYRLVEERTLNAYVNGLEDIAHSYEEGLSRFLNKILIIEQDHSLTRDEKIAKINNLLQPMTEQFLEGKDAEIGIGYYSKGLEANVSVSPNTNHLLGYTLEPDHPSTLLYTEIVTQREINSVYRGKVVRYAKLIYLEGEPVGHLWVNLPVYIYYYHLRSTLTVIFMLTVGMIFLGFFISLYVAKLVKNATFHFGEVLDNFGDNPSLYKEQKSITKFLPKEFNPLLNQFSVMRNKISELIEELTIASRLTSLGNAVTIISHDIRSPLTSIKLCAELVKKTDDINKQKQYCQQIIVASNTINNILEHLLLLAKSPEDTYENIDIENLLGELIIVLKARIHKKEINFNFLAEKNLPLLWGNRVSLEQALMNIIGNAIEATLFGGNISVKAILEEGGIKISISDTGSGIPEDIQKQIFRKFFTTKGKLGTGLGLASAHGIITTHNGRIWFDSAAGRGTTFYIWLPVEAVINSDQLIVRENASSKAAEA